MSKSLLFNTQMYQIIQKGHKTETRRPMKPQPDPVNMRWTGNYWEVNLGYPIGHTIPVCPYGKVKDIKYLPGGTIIKITNIKIEPLWNIDTKGLLEEGFNPSYEYDDSGNIHILDISMIEQLEKLWNKIYVKKGFGWNENPWVWVIKFEVVK